MELQCAGYGSGRGGNRITDEESQTSPDARATVRMALVGASALAEATGLDPLIATSNYFIGKDPKGWRSGIANYSKVKCRDVYPGIDVVYYGKQGRLEYDFNISPGADPESIRLAFAGLDGARIDDQGDLLLDTAVGQICQHKPIAYQESNGTKDEVGCRYSIKDGGEVGFELSSYDKSKRLTIDPVLSYSSYLGGNASEIARDIAVDGTGNIYITGETNSIDFPTSGGLPPTDGHKGRCIFITKLNPKGTDIIYSTYVGGSVVGTILAVESYAYGIALDLEGNVYITGETNTVDYPITPGAFQTTIKSGGSAFVTKLNAMGTALVYSTFLGGAGMVVTDIGYGIAVDASGSAYITGYSHAGDFPTTPAAFDTTLNGAGGGFGSDAFVTKLNTTGTELVYSTFLGGDGGEAGQAITVDPLMNVYVTGDTSSRDFPTTPEAFQTVGPAGSNAFVTKLNPRGDSLAYSTYLGGDGGDVGFGIDVDHFGNAYVAGRTAYSDSFPITAGAFQGHNSYWNLAIVGFVAKLSSDGTHLVYATYLGGYNTGSVFAGQTICYGIAVDATGSACMTGLTSVVNFPTTANTLQPNLKKGTPTPL